MFLFLTGLLVGLLDILIALLVTVGLLPGVVLVLALLQTLVLFSESLGFELLQLPRFGLDPVYLPGGLRQLQPQGHHLQVDGTQCLEVTRLLREGTHPLQLGVTL